MCQAEFDQIVTLTPIQQEKAGQQDKAVRRLFSLFYGAEKDGKHRVSCFMFGSATH
jgi:hypothetical protein